jgi:hypothetical protein
MIFPHLMHVFHNQAGFSNGHFGGASEQPSAGSSSTARGRSGAVAARSAYALSGAGLPSIPHHNSLMLKRGELGIEWKRPEVAAVNPGIPQIYLSLPPASLSLYPLSPPFSGAFVATVTNLDNGTSTHINLSGQGKFNAATGVLSGSYVLEIPELDVDHRPSHRPRNPSSRVGSAGRRVFAYCLAGTTARRGR